MAKIKSRKKLVAIVTAALLVAGGSSAAFAYWSSTGEGEGTATTGTSVNFEVTKVTTNVAALAPGTSQLQTFTVKNPGTGAQNLSSVVVSIDPTWKNYENTTAADEFCGAEDYAVGNVTIATGQIAAGATVTGTVSVSMNNRDANQDACKLVSVPLVITAS